ncbi:MAG: transcription elongation factor GreA [FCB group bacterium]|jgi:transcription elongation factor GreA|nr:transcription elongation factor GreA [FCB group bacterium]
MEKLYMTQEGLDKLKAELAGCHEHKRVVANAIEVARGMGDLKENADYHAAKEAQAMLHAKIRDLGDKIARAAVFDESNIDASKVYMGATVRVLNKKTRKECSYKLVSPLETDLENGKISVRSPVGQALMGKAVGDTVVAKVPAGNLEMEILEISR